VKGELTLDKADTPDLRRRRLLRCGWARRRLLCKNRHGREQKQCEETE